MLLNILLAKTPTDRRRGRVLILLIAMAASTSYSVSNAQTVLGTAGAGFQTWTAAADLNNNGAPFWDAATTSYGAYQGNADSKNVGYCLTSSGDCVGIDSALSAPGALPFWSMTYNAASDTGGAMDPKVYFRRNGQQMLKATLKIQLSTVPTEINEFGWFETNASGSVVGATHKLFGGSGVPTGSLTPDPVGTVAFFSPTQFFGYYFSDVSEGGCFTYTLFSFNDQFGCSTHNMVVFANYPGSSHSTFWIAGEDPAGCGDGDCNLTLVKVSATEGHSE